MTTDASIGIALAPQRRLRSRPDPEERGSGDVRGQGRRPPHLSLLRAGDGRRRSAPAAAWKWICARRIADGGFEVYYQPCLEPAERRDHRLRGAGALAPSAARHDLAGRVHPDRRGDRPDQPARRMGADHGLRGGRDLARQYPARGQRLAGSVQERHAGAEGDGGAGRIRPRRRAGWSSRSPRPC